MLARTDNDFVVTQTRQPRRAGRRQAKPQILRIAFRRPGRIVAGAAGAAVAVGILVNALALQGGPHPAPFFRAAEAPHAAPLPPQRPALDPDAVASTGSAPAAGQGTIRPSRSAPAPAAAPVPAPRDGIGDMLRTGQATVQADKAVLAAQRALNKLNYGPVKPDGLYGAGTRQALERFERDRKLPVTGELNPRTARELSAASGIQPD